MRVALSSFIIIVFVNMIVLHADENSGNKYVTTVNQLLNLEPDENQIYKVDNYSFSKDAADFILLEGQVYFLKPIDGRVIGAIFIGKGSMTLLPPTQIEKDQFYRYMESENNQFEFESMLMFFADDTETELKNGAQSIKQDIDLKVKRVLNNAIEKISDEDKMFFKTPIVRFLLENAKNSYFFSLLKGSLRVPSEVYSFEISPYRNEEIVFGKLKESLFQTVDIINQFHKEEDYKLTSRPAFEQMDPLKITHTTLKCSLDYGLELYAQATIEIIPNVDSEWMYVELYKELEVDSAHWSDGSKAILFKGEENPLIWIKGQSPFTKSKKQTLTIFYHGDLILTEYIELGGSYQEFIFNRSESNWYPRLNTREEKSTFDISFIYPERFKLVCVGTQILSENVDDKIHSRWMVNKPIRNASFNIGRFTEYNITDERVVPITIMMCEDWHRGMWSSKGSEMEKQVGEDVTNSLVFFEHMFGTTDIERFYVTEIPSGHGTAYPGLIHLAWSTFQNTDRYGYDRIFRAHEVAHHWWGISVDFESYHDQWISEGLSEFSALWYFQAVSTDKGLYFEMLEKYKEWIFENRKFLFKDGVEAGPVWLGYRTNTSETMGDYGLIVYKKTAWIWHMLRTIMINLQNMNEDPFSAMMRDLFQTYKGKQPSTADIQKVVEKHIGMPMDWFFQQWIYGTDLPECKFAYKTEDVGNGKYQVSFRVKTENVSNDFEMYVPIKIDFGNDQFARLRIHVKGKNDVIKLPLLPLEPEEIIFNEFNGVLAEVEEEDWEDL